MAKPTTQKFGAGTFYIGDGATPEVFTKVCGFTEVELALDKSTNDTTVPDCDNPDAPAWTERDVVSLSWSFSFAGVMAVGSLDLIEGASFGGESTNIRFDLDGAGTGSGTPIRRYAGAAHVKHTLNGRFGEKYKINVSGEGDGELVKSNVAAA
ncbi:phage tail tube protein [Pleomorphomonas koreensis]|uniref:phage tail tube protein n=1 Tax=Pleomorphomonas koreensis TaxID=257440 RepID=UPI0003FD9C77|nr:phage tail tube protein [Pleomorphomonas koreensis]